MIAETGEEQLKVRLEAGLAQIDLDLAVDQVGRMLAYLSLLQRWNRAYNLTAVRDPLQMVPRHLLDSLSVHPYLFGKQVLDLGTGAGLPGIPLAIAAPERAFHLLDSSGKKTRFLRQVVSDLDLANVDVIQGRMESYLPEEKFATIVSRAVAATPVLLAAGQRLLDRPARLLVMKGQRPDDAEIRGLEPRPDAVHIHRLHVPFLDAERHLIDARYD
jgi:16S rRNA (guanine527-N7)-methyltransferase